MGISRFVVNNAKNTIAAGLSFAPDSIRNYYKQLVETLFWRKTLHNSGGKFYNGHMQRVFTVVFDLDKSFFNGKRVLDIGCGPIGTLEWADNTAQRIGADPLAFEYIKLNRGLQAMSYVFAHAEDLPFTDDQFDVVSIFNALDHVEDVDASISEACRVVKPGGKILLIVEIDHRPTVTEPHTFGEDIVEKFDGCKIDHVKIVDIRNDHDMYASVFDGKPRTRVGAPAILIGRLTKQHITH